MAKLEKRATSQVPGIAFITGGARGLGNAVAVSFAKEGAAGVVLVDILDDETMQRGKSAVEAYGTECLTIRADVTKEEDIEQAVAKAVEKFGRIDYAANFAGITGAHGGVMNTTREEFEKTIGINATGVFLSCKHEMLQMMKQKATTMEEGRVPLLGSVVNCASVNSIMALGGALAYTAAKHAVVGITKTAALEGRPHGIRVNAVSPGFILTDLIAPLIKEEGFGKKVWDDSVARQGRPAAFEEIGDVVVLLSTAKMSLVNGHNLVIDNGFTINESNW